jgi:urease accessory protein
MTELPPARALLAEPPPVTYDLVVLGYDERLLRRKRLVTVHGEGFLVDLPAVTNLDDHWGFLLEDGRAVQVIPAEEELIEVTGADLLRYAWHIGNRHTPCQIEASRLLIRRDYVLEAMLAGLGATLSPVSQPFMPEGGAYGTGRTMGHSHGAADHAHGDGETFGWHDHGDGHLHFHPPKLPFGHKDAT